MEHITESPYLCLCLELFLMLSSRGFKVSDFILKPFIQFLFWYRMNMCLSYFLLMLKFSTFSKEQLYEGWIFPLCMFSIKFYCCDFIFEFSNHCVVLLAWFWVGGVLFLLWWLCSIVWDNILYCLHYSLLFKLSITLATQGILHLHMNVSIMFPDL